MSRAMVPAELHPSTMAGKIICESVLYPETGTHPSLKAKTYCSKSAAQNTGMETPMSEPDMNSRSMMVFFFTAEMIPAGMPMAQATSAAKIVSLSVWGKASTIKSVTLRFSLYETPRSP